MLCYRPGCIRFHCKRQAKYSYRMEFHFLDNFRFLSSIKACDNIPDLSNSEVIIDQIKLKVEVKPQTI